MEGIVGATLDDPWACFPDDGSWRLYVLSRKVVLPCLDCCPAYQAEMLALGRCRHPEAEFEERRPGQWRGLLTAQQRGGVARDEED